MLVDDDGPAIVPSRAALRQVMMQRQKLRGLVRSAGQRAYRWTAAPIIPEWHDRTIFDAVERLPPGARLLNIGSGETIFERGAVNLDIVAFTGVQVVGDAHHLPFPDATFDAVFSNAMLEHVPAPWIVVQEIRRVLKTGGYICIQTPFLEGIHAEHDYYRFTLKGLRALFESFEEVAGGISAGPSQTVADAVRQYIALFAQGTPLYWPVSWIANWLVWPLRKLDRFIAQKKSFPVLARAYYFVGRR